MKMRNHYLVALLTAFALATLAGCGSRDVDGSPITDTTCGELRDKDSWRSVGSEMAHALTDQPPSARTVRAYETAFRTACRGAAADFKPERRARELREQAAR
jgi:hypothetical protein